MLNLQFCNLLSSNCEFMRTLYNHREVNNESFRGSKTLAGVFTLMISEIAN